MIYKMMSKISPIYRMLLLTSILAGVFIRFWGLPNHIIFFGDQGIDLLVALRLARGEFFPLVGPVLSIDNLLNPPTYYYFMAFLLKIFTSEVTVVYVFALLNICAGIFYALVLKNKTDYQTAIVFFSLYMILSSSVEQARTIWNPYPVTFFTAIAMWLFLSSDSHFSLWRYCFAVATFTVGITIYPTGLLLIPVFMFYGFNYMRRSLMKKQYVVLLNVAYFVVILLWITTPFLVYEHMHGFSSLQATLSSNMSDPTKARFVLYDGIIGLIQRGYNLLISIYYLFLPGFNYGSNTRLYSAIFAFFVVGPLLIISTYFRNVSRRLQLNAFFSSFGYKYLAVGFVPFLFLSSSPEVHRVLVFLPFVLFPFSYVVRRVMGSRKALLKIYMCLVITLICYTNTMVNIFDATKYYRQDIQLYGHVSRLYAFITKDIQTRGLALSRVDFYVITGSDVWNYEVMPLWYLLKKNNNYAVPMVTLGNDTAREVKIGQDKDAAYVICFPYSVSKKKCWDVFFRDNPKVTKLDEIQMRPYYIFFVKKET